MRCENGHDLTDTVVFGVCKQILFWVDGDERYVICKGCNIIRKIEDELYCLGCGAKANAHVKWVKGYKPNFKYLMIILINE